MTDFEKSNFRKDDNKTSCNLCQSTENPILVRRPITSMEYLSANPSRHSQTQPKIHEGAEQLIEAVKKSAIEPLDHLANEFQDLVNQWKKTLSTAVRSKEVYTLESLEYLGDFPAYTNQMKKIFDAKYPDPSKQVYQRSNTLGDHVHNCLTEISVAMRHVRGGVDERSIAMQEAKKQAHQRLAKNMGDFFGINPPRGVYQHHNTGGPTPEELVQAKQRANEAMREFEELTSRDVDFEKNMASNNPISVASPRPIMNQLAAKNFYEGNYFCSGCGVLLSASLNIDFEAFLLHVAADTNPKTDQPLKYNGPIHELNRSIRSQLQDTWSEVLDELESRISKATILLHSAQENHEKREAQKAKAARLAEIKSLKKKLESLEKGD